MKTKKLSNMTETELNQLLNMAYKDKGNYSVDQIMFELRKRESTPSNSCMKCNCDNEPQHTDKPSHTPTPWKVMNAIGRAIAIYGADKKLACEVYVAEGLEEKGIANAAVIVRAVNAHEQSLSAMKSAEIALGENLQWLNDSFDISIRQKDPKVCGKLKQLNDAWVSICNAIAKAEGKK